MVIKEEFSLSVSKKKCKLLVLKGETATTTMMAMDVDMSGVFDYDKDTLITWAEI